MSPTTELAGLHDLHAWLYSTIMFSSTQLQVAALISNFSAQDGMFD